MQAAAVTIIYSMLSQMRRTGAGLSFRPAPVSMTDTLSFHYRCFAFFFAFTTFAVE